jgi:RimJ/RimL family protein N-acetyltransferase
MSDLTLRRATEEDLPFIMETERLDGYEELVGRWDEPQHREALKDKRKVYFIGQFEAEPIGFTILRGWASPDHVTLLHRIAVAKPGQGYGRRFLFGIVGAVFRETDAFRLWLGVFPENVRARRAYEAAGFSTEGIARGISFFRGTHRDQVIMSILRPDWDRNGTVT